MGIECCYKSKRKKKDEAKNYFFNNISLYIK